MFKVRPHCVCVRALCALLTLASTCRKTARGGPYFAATSTFVSAIQPVAVAVAVSVSMLCCFICTGMSDCQGRKKYDAPGVTKDDNLEEHLLTRCHCPGPDSCQSPASAVSWCQVVQSHPHSQQNTTLENGLSSAGHKSSFTTSLSG